MIEPQKTDKSMLISIESEEDIEFQKDLNIKLESITTRDIDDIFIAEIKHIVNDTDAATAAKYGQFWIAPFSCNIVEVKEVHSTAGTDVGAVTLNVEKLTGTTAEGAGVSVLSSTFDLKGTTNTVVTKTPSSTATSNVLHRYLEIGDRLALLTSGTLTSVNNVVIIIVVAIKTKNFKVNPNL